MSQEFDTKKLVQLGFRNDQAFSIDHGSIGVNNVISFSHEQEKSSLDMIPARFLAGFIPMFLLAETIQQQTGQQPLLRIFFPKNLAYTINEIPKKSIDEQITITTKLLTALQTICFPTVAVSFCTDRPLDTPTLQELEDIHAIISSAATEEQKQIIESIQESAFRHGNSNGVNFSNIYIAHHPVGWQEIESLQIFPESIPNIVINTLPPSEKRFLILRRSIRHKLRDSKKWKTPQAIIDIDMNIAGAPYLFLRDKQKRLIDEPSIGDALATPISTIFQRFQHLKMQTGDDNVRKAKNDFQRIIDVIAQRTQQDINIVMEQTLTELLGVKLW